jgi:hypothetical protein
MKLTFNAYANSKLKGTDAELTNLVRVDANSAGWPKKIASKLVVSFSNSKLIINYPSEFAEEVDNLEYGTRVSSPQPVFRRFESKHGDVISGKIETISVNYLVEQNIIP